ncbi:MAG: class I SAM-dependent methyltransferase [Chitinophagaceae bacterium]|nr:MAG: class I SAM-dependent methyltransferase [Chitinophagaceae bacterium]
MRNKVQSAICPICNSSNTQFALAAKDFTVSGEEFNISECKQCSFWFTQNAPDELLISNYYNSKNYISHTNSSAGLINKLYQIIRKNTICKKQKLIEKITNKGNGNLLDVGSGTGFFAGTMKKAGWNVVGIEPDENTRKLALELNNVELIDANIFFQLLPNQFDVITLWHVLEHVHSLKPYVQKLKELLKQDGKLVIAVPNHDCFDAKFFKQYWAAYDVPRHLYHFNFESLNLLIENEGMRLEKIKPMWFDSFYISLLSSKYKYKNTRWMLALMVGLWSNVLALIHPKRCSSLVFIFSK